jgi:uncharacterized membrane protein YhaH (DUF805 family)
MLHHPFSFNGRIGRFEYGLTFLANLAFLAACWDIVKSEPSREIGVMVLVCFLINFWFFFAQGAKRCHDMGICGWYQLIPFYMLYMIFKKADGNNKYGDMLKVEGDLYR